MEFIGVAALMLVAYLVGKRRGHIEIHDIWKDMKEKDREERAAE